MVIKNYIQKMNKKHSSYYSTGTSFGNEQEIEEDNIKKEKVKPKRKLMAVSHFWFI